MVTLLTPVTPTLLYMVVSNLYHNHTAVINKQLQHILPAGSPQPIVILMIFKLTGVKINEFYSKYKQCHLKTARDAHTEQPIIHFFSDRPSSVL